MKKIPERERKPPPPMQKGSGRVAPMSCFKEGFLEKKGGGTSKAGRRNWKKRWFVLTDKKLMYFTVSGEKKGELSLPRFISAEGANPLPTPEKDQKHPFCFSFRAQNLTKKGRFVRVLLMEAGSKDVKEEWLRYLNAVGNVYIINSKSEQESYTQPQKSLCNLAMVHLTTSATFVIYGDRFIRDSPNKQAQEQMQEVLQKWTPLLICTIEAIVAEVKEATERNVKAVIENCSKFAKLLKVTSTVWSEVSEGQLIGETKTKVSAAIESMQKTLKELGEVCASLLPVKSLASKANSSKRHHREKKRHKERHKKRERKAKSDKEREDKKEENNVERTEKENTEEGDDDDSEHSVEGKMLEVFKGLDDLVKKKKTGVN